MADFYTHCMDCEEILGRPFKGVHPNLDSFVSILGKNYHRSKKHNIETVIEFFYDSGFEVALAAEIHIRRDCLGYLPSKSDYEYDYVNNLGWPVHGLDQENAQVLLKSGNWEITKKYCDKVMFEH